MDRARIGSFWSNGSMSDQPATSDQPTVSDQPTSPLAVVNTFIGAVERRDLDAAMALLADACVYDNVPMKPISGHEAIRAVLASFLGPCTEVAWPVHRQAESGPVVFNERTDRFHMPHGWVELNVTGVWEVHHGKITLWRDYFDLATYTDQMPARD
jgi:limonene-1,2-epoxide hydrolase